MGKKSRDKGNRFERECVNRLQSLGIGAERVPLSGAAGGSFGSDLIVPVQGRDRKIECKKRADGFAQLYTWIEGNYGLFVSRDRSETLVVLRLSDFVSLAVQAGPQHAANCDYHADQNSFECTCGLTRRAA